MILFHHLSYKFSLIFTHLRKYVKISIMNENLYIQKLEKQSSALSIFLMCPPESPPPPLLKMIPLGHENHPSPEHLKRFFSLCKGNWLIFFIICFVMFLLYSPLPNSISVIQIIFSSFLSKKGEAWGFTRSPEICFRLTII